MLLKEKEKPTIHLGVYGVLIRIYLHVSVDSIVQGALLRVPRNRFLRAMCYCFAIYRSAYLFLMRNLY